MRATLEIDMPESCHSCPLTLGVTDSEGNLRGVCAYTKKCFQGEKKRLRGCPLKEAELETEEATYTDEERKEILAFTETGIRHRKEIINVFDAINKVIKSLLEDKKDDVSGHTLTLGIGIENNLMQFEVMDYNEYKLQENNIEE